MNAALATGFYAFAVASLVLRVARVSAKMLAIQCALARVHGVVYAFDQSRSNLLDVQVPRLALSAFPLALLGTATHRLVTKFGASDGGRVFMASNPFRVFAVRKLLLYLFLTFDGLQVFKQMAEYDESSG